jgi:iron(III) transport system permease protein
VTALALVTVTIHYARPVYQTEVTLFLAYLLMFMPRALINLRAGIAQAPVELENVARSLGRSPARALWSITMRLAAPGAAAGAALVFLGVSNELTATLLLAVRHPHVVDRLLGVNQRDRLCGGGAYALLMIIISLPLTAVLYMQSKKMAGL